ARAPPPPGGAPPRPPQPAGGRARARPPPPLDAAVRALPSPAGEGFAWAAAESRALLPVRRYLQRERKLPKDRVNITGYWHREE
ncbi:SIP domain-containing protein, partial [Streptomyces anulatus]|uniref:SIP domain-containing protein n=1 Tax=Streptomyces anulatus TaxID=1892 RepID=UPI003665756B